jgi:hypothetical protein
MTLFLEFFSRTRKGKRKCGLEERRKEDNFPSNNGKKNSCYLSMLSSVVGDSVNFPFTELLDTGALKIISQLIPFFTDLSLVSRYGCSSNLNHAAYANIRTRTFRIYYSAFFIHLSSAYLSIADEHMNLTQYAQINFSSQIPHSCPLGSQFPLIKFG